MDQQIWAGSKHEVLRCRAWGTISGCGAILAALYLSDSKHLAQSSELLLVRKDDSGIEEAIRDISETYET